MPSSLHMIYGVSHPTSTYGVKTSQLVSRCQKIRDVDQEIVVVMDQSKLRTKL